MNEFDRDPVFSKTVKAGKRIYYFDVKQSRSGDRYISITESKKIVDGPAENPHFTFEKHKLFLYKEDYEKFVNALTKTLEVAKTGIIPEKEESDLVENSPANDAVETENVETATLVQNSKTVADTFKIDLDF